LACLRRFALAIIAMSALHPSGAHAGSERIERYVEASKSKAGIQESGLLHTLPLKPIDIRSATNYVLSNPNYSSYHLLMGIREQQPESYKSIPTRTKTDVLCSALGNLMYFNDWGSLSHNGESAKALIETGTEAVGALRPFLDDGRPAPSYGSKTAT